MELADNSRGLRKSIGYNGDEVELVPIPGQLRCTWGEKSEAVASLFYASIKIGCTLLRLFGGWAGGRHARGGFFLHQGSSLAKALAQVGQLRPAHRTFAFDFHLLDAR
jgi:hypothetical protein